MIAIEYPDLEHDLGPHLRATLAAWNPLVDRQFPTIDPDNPDQPWAPGFAVVIRDDGGPDRDQVTTVRTVGFTVIGADYEQAGRLARRLAAVLRALPDACVLPIADATVRGPYSLDATNRAEFYLTAELVVVGHPINLHRED